MARGAGTMSYALKFEPNYPEYCNIYDRMFCHTLIREILDSGFSVTVHDGEDYCLMESKDFAEILESMSQSGEDFIIPCDSAIGRDEGWFHLIYDNGSEREPMICMTDMSANHICEAIDNRVQRILEEQEL